MTEEDDHNLMMHNSGPLGVPGNIGFSTALHGLHTAAYTGSFSKGVCVGDDAFMFTNDTDGAIIHVQYLGNIHRDKFDIVYPMATVDEKDHITKFLKRRLQRLPGDKLHLDTLFDFPILSLVWQEVPDDRTYRGSKAEFVLKFARHVGSLYWKIFEHHHPVTDEDMQLTTLILQRAYSRLRLPYAGSFPFITTNLYDNSSLPICIVPLTMDPRLEDWAENLWRESRDPYCLANYQVSGEYEIEPFYRVGQSFEVTESRYLKVLEDIGCVELKALKERWEPNDSNLRKFRMMLSRESRTLYRAVYLMPPPSYHTIVIAGVSGGAVPQEWHAVDYQSVTL